MKGRVAQISKTIELWGFIEVEDEPQYFHFSPNDVLGGEMKFQELVVGDKVSFDTNWDLVGDRWIKAFNIRRRR